MTTARHLVPLASFEVRASGHARVAVALAASAVRYRYFDVSLQTVSGGDRPFRRLGAAWTDRRLRAALLRLVCPCASPITSWRPSQDHHATPTTLGGTGAAMYGGMNVRRWMFATGPVIAATGLGGLGARRAARIYSHLHKPSWAPPAAAFGPVWSALYVAIGVAGWRLFANASRPTKSLHLTQLAFNAAWPFAFFSVRDKRASLLIIALLDGALTAEIWRLGREDPIAAILLVPYLGWSGFATALNAAVSDPGKHR
jgi:benzodiazapine receptor